MKIAAFHSSGDFYGSDKVFLATIDSMLRVGAGKVEIEAFLPSDAPLSDAFIDALTSRGVSVEAVDLPILRRSLLHRSEFLGFVYRSIAVWKLLRAASPSAIYLGSTACLVIAWLAKFASVQTVWVHCQEIWAPQERRVLGLLGRPVSEVWCISRASLASLNQHLQKRARLVRNGATNDPPIIPGAGSNRGSVIRFLIGSRWNSWKGHGTLLEAWSLAQLDGELWIAGSAPEAGVGVDVIELVDSMPNLRNVKVLGQLASLAEVISVCDVLVVPSDEPEPFGLVAVEAFGLGVPVIASAGGGLMEIVHDENGWLFPPGDAAALAKVLREVDRSSVEVKGARARLSYVDNFSKAAFGCRLDAVVRPWLKVN